MTLSVEDYRDLAKPRPSVPFAVRSTLRRGEAGLRSRFVSYKSVTAGAERYYFLDVDTTLPAGAATLTPAHTDVRVEIPRAAAGVCVFVPEEMLVRMIGDAASDDLAGGEPRAFDLYGMRFPLLPALSALGGRALGDDGADGAASALAEEVVRLRMIDARLPTVRASARAELAFRLEKARAFLMDRLDGALSLDEVARAACLSRHHLARSFRQAFGAPPMQYRQNERLRRARGRVAEGEPLAPIAEDLGFAGVAPFSRAYARVHGARPSAHRPGAAGARN